MPATASSPFSTPARCCTASTTSRRSSTTAIASTRICRPAARCAGMAASTVRHAFEMLFDRMARELGLDPFAVRRRNLLTRADPHRQRPDDQQLRPRRVPRLGRDRRAAGASGSASCRPARGSAWPARTMSAARRSRSTGPASRTRSSTSRSTSTAGSPRSPAPPISARARRPWWRSPSPRRSACRLERVRVIAGDSAITPKDNGAYSSRITFMVGNAAIDRRKEPEIAADRRRRAQARSASGGRRTASTACSGRPRRTRPIALVRRGGERGAGRSRHDHGEGHVHLSARRAGRQAQRRRGRLHHGLQLRRAGGAR